MSEDKITVNIASESLLLHIKLLNNKNSSVDEIANVNAFTRFYDDSVVHVEARAYTQWTDFLSMLIYSAAIQGHSSTSFIIVRCEPA